MKESRLFDEPQIKAVESAVSLAEELVSNHFKMSSSQWFKSRYDIRTAINLADHERVDGPFAQVVGYEARKKENPFGSSLFNFYRICLQDGAILDAVERREGFLLFPFVLYVAVHELIHIVRFTRFEQIYEASATPGAMVEEEDKVHELTLKILYGIRIDGLSAILDYYGGKSVKSGFDRLV
jgi:hypothetical protein